MEALAARLATGLQLAVTTYGVPWHVLRVGARVEFICAPGPLRNGAQAEAAHAPALEQAIHLALLNRGCLIAPFHNMMLVSPDTTAAQVETLVQAFEAAVASLVLDPAN
jgi:glutamate-1-semialdehyde 2,1-aminomutase